MSYNKEAYLNKNAHVIEMSSIINFENASEITVAQEIIKESEKKQEKTEPKEKTKLPDDIFSEIKQKLNPKIKKRKEKNIYVPEKLNTIIDKIKERTEEFNIKIIEIININYGKQIRFELKHYWGELNIFYGKKGFSLVKSAKQKCNAELNDIMYKIICQILF